MQKKRKKKPKSRKTHTYELEVLLPGDEFNPSFKGVWIRGEIPHYDIQKTISWLKKVQEYFDSIE